MRIPEPGPPIACELDALAPSERARRAELARTIQERSIGVHETDSGFRVKLPGDSETCERVLELLLLERRCCPFLSLQLAFEPGDAAAVLAIGGPPGVKEFLRENGVFGRARPSESSACC
jgi:hypothetical protein